MSSSPLRDADITITDDELTLGAQEYPLVMLNDAGIKPHYEGKDRILNGVFTLIYALAFVGAILTGAGFVIFMALGAEGSESMAVIFLDRMLIFGLPFVLCVGAAFGIRMWRRSRPQKLLFIDPNGREQSAIVTELNTAETIQEAINER